MVVEPAIAKDFITIGSGRDNVRSDAAGTPWPDANVRHLMLKEIPVLAGGTINFDSGPQPVVNGAVLNQEDGSFRAQECNGTGRCATPRGPRPSRCLAAPTGLTSVWDSTHRR